MGILSRLWSKNTESSSYVRRWLMQERDRDEAEQGEVFALFVELIGAVSRFGKEETDGRFQETARQYLGDTTLFEIACYTYYRLEAWLAVNEPGVGPGVSGPIAGWIIEVFAVAWQSDEDLVGRRFTDRLDGYRTRAKEAREDEIQLELAQRILATKGDRLARNGEEMDRSIQEEDRLYVQQSMGVYEATQIPALLEAARSFGTKQTKPAVKGKKPLSIEERSEQENRDYLFAMALLKQEDFRKACQAFTRVLETNPDNYDALLQRGQLYVRLRQPLEAIEDFSQAIAVNPGDWRAYFQRGKCYHRVLRMGDESAADFSKVIALEPDNPVGYFERGSLFDAIAVNFEQQAGENKSQESRDQAARGFQAATEDFSRAIALNPEYDDAYVGRGLAYGRKARTEGNGEYAAKAIADLETAISVNWEHGYLHKMLDELQQLAEQDRKLTTV